ncbi:MAG: His/Gly/Thr/Pro-type tRNA ligase C-terminal domain-containing protein [Candidatus Pacebacteria bacterium]|nr:His/Gly/Thr/Pro-type tRNA ligase C-terminal domain-containing protein [Candidatus Paceibacterota bacterium]
MRQSQLFTKTRKEAPSDEVSKNAQLLIRGGYIHKRMAGVYEFLPLGLRVFNKITDVIREEMNAIGGQELKLTALQDPAIWKKTDRWSDEAIDVWFKSELANGTEVGFGTTHEEPITQLFSEYISSYKDLPRYAYQFQTKFRNELRAKSGIMRAREFVMKDLYSFSRSEEEFREFYEQAAEAYMKIFDRLGIGDRTYRTFASGGAFSKYSDEFQTLSDAGEDTIYIHEEKGIAVNKEVYTDEVLRDLGITKNELKEEKAVEVGNIFPLGTRFSDALNLTYKDEEGKAQPVTMGSYGIGPGRLMGTVVEVLADEKGIVWPEEIAPFQMHLVSLAGDDERVSVYADELYERLTASGVEVLYDDRDLRAGEKFADSDLIGVPTRIVVSKKTLEAGMIERVDRRTGEVDMIKEEVLFV